MPRKRPPGFEARPQDINRKGRPRESITFRKLKKYTKEEIMDAFWKVSTMTRDDIIKFQNDKSTTLLEQALLKRIIKGDVEVIINRLMGFPKQSVEMHTTSLTGELDTKGMTEEQKKKLYFKMVNKQ